MTPRTRAGLTAAHRCSGGRLRSLMPALWFSALLLLGVAPSQAKAGNALLQAPALHCWRPPVVDGDLGEWSADPYVPLAARSQLTDGGDWTGPQDLAARVRFRWDADYLYIAAAVTDDKAVGDNSPGTDDGLTLYLAAQPHGAVQTFLFPLQTAADNPLPALDPVSLREIPGTRSVFHVVPGGYNLEAAVSWRTMAMTPQSGLGIGMNVEIDDSDQSGHRKSVMRWCIDPTAGAGAPAALSGRLTLIDQLSPRNTAAFFAGLTVISPDRPFYLHGEPVVLHAVSGLAPAVQATAWTGAITVNGHEAPLGPGTPWHDTNFAGREWQWQAPCDAEGDFAAVCRVSLNSDCPHKVQAIRGEPLTVTGIVPCRQQEYDQLMQRWSALDSRFRQLALSAPNRDAVSTYLWEQRATLEMLRSLATSSSRPSLASLAATIDMLTASADKFAAGDNPYASRRGSFVKAYLSPIDDSLQPYTVYVPDDYDPDRLGLPAQGAGNPTSPAYPDGRPLLLRLHGYGGSYSAGVPEDQLKELIVVNPEGRGNTDYKAWGEEDILEVIRAVERCYRIDVNRVYLHGASMGGTGSWQVATHYPDLFAAIAPVCGNADHRVWEAEWGWGQRAPTFLTSVRDFVADCDSSVFLAENLAHVPVYCVHGTADNVVPVGHSRSMVSRLRSLGYDVTYDEQKGAGHGGFHADTYSRIFTWLLQQRRDPYPKHVVFKTAKLRYHRAYWVNIEQIDSPLRFARIDAQVVGPNNIQVVTANIGRFSLDLDTPLIDAARPVQITVDGALTLLPAQRWSEPLAFERQTVSNVSVWRPAAPHEGMEKRPGLEGPVEDALLSRFLIVYGTAGDAHETDVNRTEAQRLTDFWKHWANAAPRVKSDADVTADDIRDSNLILYGNPGSNRIIARINNQLPIRFDGDAVLYGSERLTGEDLGIKLVHPNPLNPDRYVVIAGGTTWRGTVDINGRFGNWFDWGLYDNRSWFDYGVFDRESYSPETFVVAGFFGLHWNIDPRFAWRGDKEIRDKAPDKRLPDQSGDAVSAPDVYLSDLTPLSVNMPKGVLGIDRSFGGHPLRIGIQSYAHGLGVHPPSEVVYSLKGKFRTFEAWAGIDLEGDTRVAKAREYADQIEFRVYGDDRLLAKSSALRWDSKPVHFYVNIQGVDKLKLVTAATGGSRWLWGSNTWAEARVGEPPLRNATVAPAPTSDAYTSELLSSGWTLTSRAIGDGVEEGLYEHVPDADAVTSSSSGYEAPSSPAPMPAPMPNGYPGTGYGRGDEGSGGVYNPDSYDDNSAGNFGYPGAVGPAPGLSAPPSLYQVQVPSTVQAVLIAAGQAPDPAIGKNADTLRSLEQKEWWYHTHFEVPQAWNQRRIVLNFEGVTYAADVWVNGRSVGSTAGSFLPATFDITPYVKPGEQNLLAVRVTADVAPWSLPPGGFTVRPRTERATVPSADGEFQAPALNPIGIWQPVQLKTTGPISIDAVRADTTQLSGDAATLAATARVSNHTDMPVAVKLHFVVQNDSGAGAERIEDITVPAGAASEVTAQLQLTHPAMWCTADLGTPRLADLKVTAVLDSGAVSDVQTRRIGIRQVLAVGNKLQLNGHDLRLRGVDWYPGLLWSESPTAVRDRLRQLASCGVNLIRVRGAGGIAPDDFYSACDELGFFVIQELPLAPGDFTKTNWDLLTQTAAAAITRLASHPSLLAWVGGDSLNADDPLLQTPLTQLAALFATQDPVHPFVASLPATGGGCLNIPDASGRAMSIPIVATPLPPDLGGADRFANAIGRDAIYPMDDAWTYHKAAESAVTAATADYGDPDNAADLDRWLHAAQIEGAREELWERAVSTAPIRICGAASDPWPMLGSGLYDWTGVGRPAAEVWRRGSESLQLATHVSRSVLDVGDALEVSALVVNRGAQDATGLHVELQLHDDHFTSVASASSRVDVAAGQNRAVDPLRVIIGDVLAGQVLVLHQRLITDDDRVVCNAYRWLAVRARSAYGSRLRVLWITSDGESVRRRFAFLQPFGIHVETVDWLSVRTRCSDVSWNAAPADCIVLDAAAVTGRRDDATLTAILQRVREGAGLLLDGVPAHAPGELSDAMPVAAQPWGERESAAAPAALADHPVCKGIEPADLPPIGHYVAYAAKSDAVLVLAAKAGDPILAETFVGRGRVGCLVNGLSGTWLTEAIDRHQGGDLLLVNLLAYLARLSPRDIATIDNGPRTHPFADLANVAGATLTVDTSAKSIHVEKNTQATSIVTIRNPGDVPALFVAIAPDRVYPNTRFQVSDNYFALEPGEERRVALQWTGLPALAEGGEVHISVTPLNGDPVLLPLVVQCGTMPIRPAPAPMPSYQNGRSMSPSGPDMSGTDQPGMDMGPEGY